MSQDSAQGFDFEDLQDPEVLQQNQDIDAHEKKLLEDQILFNV